MGKIIKSNLACLDPKCGSSDARRLYEDRTSFCFSCQEFFPADESDMGHSEDTPIKSNKVSAIDLAEIKAYQSRGFEDRKIPKVVCEFYGVKVSYGSDGEIDTHYYPYDDGNAYKVRTLPKKFSWVGKSTKLFGQEKFQGGNRKLIITEGEIDALSISWAQYERYEKFYPVVAMSSASMAKSLLENRDWIRSFGEVILALDNDDAGKNATDEAIKIIGLDKVKLMKFPQGCKDPNDVLLKKGPAALMQLVFDAQPHIPNGIITRDALWQALVEYNKIESTPYPSCLSEINQKAKGARPGEIALFVSGTSCGKSTLMREIMLSFKEKTDDKIGVVSLEEAPAETARKLSGMAVHKNPAKEELTEEELKRGFDNVFGDDRFVVLDHQGSLKDETILDKIEFMALSGCKWIIIDHITILVSEGADGLTGNEAIDKTMNDLLRFVKRHNVWIGLVSHLRKTNNTGKAFEDGRMPNLDDIKGSGSIKQICFDIFAFARNLQDEDVIARNTIDMSILKCRYTGLTGPAGKAYYHYDTGRFMRPEDAPVEQFTQLE